MGAGSWRGVRPGVVALLTLVVIWGGLVLAGAPQGPALAPAALCALGNLALLRSDARRDVPDIPDTVPAAWSGLEHPEA